jgi:exodeoxyribonuclease VII small subunit
VQGLPAPEAAVTSKKGKTLDFEQALGELEAVVERLEHGELPLEDALKQFERGIELARSCQASLKQAEQKVEILLQKTPDAEPEPFEPEE